jgi:hypothetical protein
MKQAKPDTSKAPTTAFGKAMDFFEGKQRYDSSKEVGSAPSMARRKDANQATPKQERNGGKVAKDRLAIPLKVAKGAVGAVKDRVARY